MSDHSKGPWKAHKQRVFVEGGYFLASADSPYVSDKAADANARLIAAAPDLLEALKTILRDWEAVDPDAQVPDAINNNDHWDAVRAAISKAEEE